MPGHPGPRGDAVLRAEYELHDRARVHTSGFFAVTSSRLKSRSAVSNSLTPCKRQSAATLASCMAGPLSFELRS